MDDTDVDRWLGSYVEAWKTYDPDLIGSLFADDIKYRYHPYDEPVVGPRRRRRVLGWRIGRTWLSTRDAPGTYDASYAAAAVCGDVAVATRRHHVLRRTGRQRRQRLSQLVRHAL